MAKELAGRPLLPGLREVIVEDLDEMASNFLQLLLTPSLVSLRIQGKALSREHCYQSLFPCLLSDSPGLKHITLAHSDPNFRFDTTVMPQILGLRHLQSLEYSFPGTPVSPTFISDIAARLPLLRHLKLDVNFSHPNNACETTDGAMDQFPSIESLHLVVCQLSRTCHGSDSSLRFCASWSPPFLALLTSLTIQLEDTWSSFSELIRSLSQAPKLSRLELTQGHRAEITVHAVLQLIKIPALEELIIDLDATCEEDSSQRVAVQVVEAVLSDRSRKAVLKTLVLPATVSYPLSLKELKWVSQKAIGLERLAVAVNSALDPVRSPVEAETDIISSSTLRILEIYDTRSSKTFPLMELSTIAQYLDRIAPNLQSLAHHHSRRASSSAREERWAFIEHLRQKEKLLRALAQY